MCERKRTLRSHQFNEVCSKCYKHSFQHCVQQEDGNSEGSSNAAGSSTNKESYEREKKVKQKSRSEKELENVFVNAQRYIKDHPEYINELENPSLISYKSIRENMSMNKDDYISKRVIALVAEEIHKEKCKCKLLNEFLTELNHLETEFPKEIMNSVSDETLLNSLDKVLDIVIVDNDSEN